MEENKTEQIQEKRLTFALAGNPNSGKTTLFNSLTGASAYVGNWPGVTVERRSGTYKNKDIGTCDIVDLPGIYSLSPYSPEEVISRNFVLDEKPDLVINIIDGTNIERNLYMTTQIIEMDVPMVICINMIDVVKKQGLVIDTEALSKIFSVPVIAVSALKRENLDELMKLAIETSKTPRKGHSILTDTPCKDIIEQAQGIYEAEGIENPLFHALKAIENDEIERDIHPEEVEKCSALYHGEEDFESYSADQRYKFITSNLHKFLSGKLVKNSEKMSTSDKIDKVLTNKYVGIPLFLIILFVMFELTFSEDLFFLKAAGVFGDEGLNTPLGWIGCGNGIESPGYFLSNMVNWCTDWITVFFSDVLLKNASTWVTSMICDGILAGVFAVIGFLPQILTLFFFFSILEDSGYMARVAFILDRLFRKFGLSGRALIPMIMGFGCSVPAIMNTRTLTSDKEKTQTIRVVPFFSCSAKLPIISACAGALLSSFGVPGANFIVYGVYVGGMAIAIISVIIMHGTTQREKIPPFIMEFPNYHLPQPRALLIHVWDKAKHFFKKTFGIILISTFCVWLFTRISWDWHYLGQDGILFAYLEDGNTLYAVLDSVEGIDESVLANLVEQGLLTEDYSLIEYNAAVANGMEDLLAVTEVVPDVSKSILGSLGSFISPLFTPMGFGASCAYAPHIIAGGGSWSFSVSAITGLVAKENAIGTFGTLASAFPIVQSGANIPSDVIAVLDTELDEGVGAVSAIIRGTFLTNADGSLVDTLKTSASVIAFVMFNITTIPCFAAVGSAKSELADSKSFLGTILFWLFASYLTGTATYMMIAYWWTTFIWVALLAGTFVSIRFYNKKRDGKVGAIA